MILTQSFRAKQPRSLLDDTNRESGRIYTKTMATHWRIFRKHGIWLQEFDAMRLNDYLAPGTTLHAHSRDAAQQGFYKACKVAKTLKKAGDNKTRYPHWRKFYRTTIWKSAGIRVKGDIVLLARARGLEPIKVNLPAECVNVIILEVLLVYNQKAKHYNWHMVIDDKIEKPAPLGANTIAVDMGEIHPAAACDQDQAVVFSARELRSTVQGRNKKLAELAALQSKCKRGSRRYKRLQRVKNKVKGATERKTRDINHKVSRAVVNFAIERKAGTIVVGDVRDLADGIDCGKVHNQRMSQWTHGQLRSYITYKAAMVGASVVLQDERYTSQTCPCCGNRRKVKGRTYHCPKCGWIGSRDGQVGAPNILSAYLYKQLARVQVTDLKYRYPFVMAGKRRRPDTAHVACVEQEATGL